MRCPQHLQGSRTHTGSIGRTIQYFLPITPKHHKKSNEINTTTQAITSNVQHSYFIIQIIVRRFVFLE